MNEADMELYTGDGGAEITIAAMTPIQRYNIGRSTYLFVRRLMRNPEYKALIKAKAAELRAAAATEPTHP